MLGVRIGGIHPQGDIFSGYGVHQVWGWFIASDVCRGPQTSVPLFSKLQQVLDGKYFNRSWAGNARVCLSSACGAIYVEAKLGRLFREKGANLSSDLDEIALEATAAREHEYGMLVAKRKRERVMHVPRFIDRAVLLPVNTL